MQLRRSCQSYWGQCGDSERVRPPPFAACPPPPLTHPDLLDILSKGSNPQLILRHLPKFFDNVDNLSFKKVGGAAAKLGSSFITSRLSFAHRP